MTDHTQAPSHIDEPPTGPHYEVTSDYEAAMRMNVSNENGA